MRVRIVCILGSGRRNKMERTLSRVARLQGQLTPSVVSNNKLAGSSDHPTVIIGRERSHPSFDVAKLTSLMLGGENASQLVKRATEFIMNDPILFDKESPHDLPLAEARERTMAKIKRFVEIINDKSLDPELVRGVTLLLHAYDTSFSMRLGVHFVLFKTALEGGGSEEQIKKFAHDIQTMGVIGCFGMTEFGGGSSIQQFETTATFDKSKDQFVIHSPTLTSTKWWMGMAAHTATHCIVFARLINDGKDLGVHNFVVPLRDPKTGHLLPGVSIGDIGAKWGRQGLDNGWIRFNNVRIGRDGMLQKWAQMSAEGVYTSPPIPQLSYGALLGGRVAITKYSGEALKVGLTIAVRYGAVRKQHTVNTDETGDTRQLYCLDLQAHQMRLMPLLADTFAIHFASIKLAQDYEAVLEKLKNFDLSALADFHSTAAGLKTWATWMAQDGIETCRRCCGGHGYSQYTGLSTLLEDFAVYITGEGDNMVMAQQNARYLLSKYKKGFFSKSLENTSIDYLIGSERVEEEKFTDHLQGRGKAGVLDLNVLLAAFRHLAVTYILRTARRVQSEIRDKNLPANHVWNICMMDLVQASKVHCLYLMMKEFKAEVDRRQKDSVSNGIYEALKRLCETFGLSHLSQEMRYLLEDGYMTAEHARWIDALLRDNIKTLRMDAVPLVDSFGLPDLILRSCIGKYDGNVYENYFAEVNASRIQKLTDNGRPAYWDTLVKPLLRIEN